MKESNATYFAVMQTALHSQQTAEFPSYPANFIFSIFTFRNTFISARYSYFTVTYWDELYHSAND